MRPDGGDLWLNPYDGTLGPEEAVDVNPEVTVTCKFVCTLAEYLGVE